MPYSKLDGGLTICCASVCTFYTSLLSMTLAPSKIATLVVTRSVVAMGILAANIAAFHPPRWLHEMLHERLYFLYFTSVA